MRGREQSDQELGDQWEVTKGRKAGSNRRLEGGPCHSKKYNKGGSNENRIVRFRLREGLSLFILFSRVRCRFILVRFYVGDSASWGHGQQIGDEAKIKGAERGE